MEKRPNGFKDIRSFRDFLYFKYENPHKGGITRQAWKDAKRDADMEDYTVIYLKDEITGKVKKLYCIDIDLKVYQDEKQGSMFRLKAILWDGHKIGEYTNKCVLGNNNIPLADTECISMPVNLKKFKSL